MEEKMDTLLGNPLRNNKTLLSTDEPQFDEMQQVCRVLCMQWDVLQDWVFKPGQFEELSKEHLDEYYADAGPGEPICRLTNWAEKIINISAALKYNGDKYTKKGTNRRLILVHFNNLMGKVFWTAFFRACLEKDIPRHDASVAREDGHFVIRKWESTEPYPSEFPHAKKL